MSNNVNDAFIDSLAMFTKLIAKYPAYAFDEFTPNNKAKVQISWNGSVSNSDKYETPFLDVHSGESWDVAIYTPTLTSKVFNLRCEYDHTQDCWYLVGTAKNGHIMSSPIVKSGEMPLNDFYPKLKEIMRGKEPAGFAFFTVSLAFALKQDPNLNYWEFRERWDFVTEHQHIYYMHAGIE